MLMQKLPPQQNSPSQNKESFSKTEALTQEVRAFLLNRTARFTSQL